MTDSEHLNSRLLFDLQERAKELKCMYNIEEIVNKSDMTIDEVFMQLLKCIPPAWLYPEVCQAMLIFENRVFKSVEFTPTQWKLTADIIVQKEIVGEISVFYLEDKPKSDIGPFLREEKQLLETIADRISHYILYHRLRDINEELSKAVATTGNDDESNWRSLLNLLLKSDKDLYKRASRKMLNYLCSMGVEKAWEILDRTPSYVGPIDKVIGEVNQPIRKKNGTGGEFCSEEIFELAAEHFSAEELLSKVEKWLQEDRANNIIRVIDSRHSTFQDIELALRRFQHLLEESKTLPEHTRNALCVSLTRRFLTEQLEFIMIAKNIFDVSDFNELVGRSIANPDSFGKIGGKGAGLFLAKKILANEVDNDGLPVGKVLTPKTWYLVSDTLYDFVSNNDLDDVFEQKYKDIDRVRHEYPNIVQLFKNSNFPHKLIQGLSMALDDFGEVPIIVRSSSLLEDRLGTAFSGKYKSLFLPNNGTREERLSDLIDAISEIYASVFSPDPIAYRKENDLLDFSEEMGILIQEVVGKQIGKYFLPAFAGVAFSNNEFRWSPRIAQKDGLVRIVPGLGTRAVDRLDDDYPFLAVPKKPTLRVNSVPSEVINYSPKKIDVIDLEDNKFVTLDIEDLIKEVKEDFPGLSLVFSSYKDGIFSKVNQILLDVEKDTLVANFETLLSTTDFIRNISNILTILEDNLGTPVDIEFAFDGENFYLLQCRPQSYSPESSPASIPQDIPVDDTLFSATKHISNGWVPDISHIVYVDPEAYDKLETKQQMIDVGRAVGQLNKLLPKRQFILMGPGRWGSRGDIKLGVRVTYSDINNTAMMIEIARKKGGYVPDLSFGTHFFQDLVEANIRYLPLYPDSKDEGVVFNHRFFKLADNILCKLLPDYNHLEHVVKVIEIQKEADNKILKVLMNAELEKAVAILADKSPDEKKPVLQGIQRTQIDQNPEHWQWRLRMAERIARSIEAENFGIVALYLLGSTKNATAGPASDLDLLIHFRGSKEQYKSMMQWFKAWSQCLAEMNYLRTGYDSDELLDVHVITDEDIEKRTSWALKINAITDPAREMPLGK